MDKERANIFIKKVINYLLTNDTQSVEREHGIFGCGRYIVITSDDKIKTRIEIQSYSTMVFGRSYVVYLTTLNKWNRRISATENRGELIEIESPITVTLDVSYNLKKELWKAMLLCEDKTLEQNIINLENSL